MTTDRRTFLQMLGAGAAGAAALPDSIAKALAIPASTRTGTIADVEHIVILMQENRSFDHYFGTMRGVRGYGDPRAVKLDSGKSVFHQPNGTGELLPFRADVPNVGSTFVEDLAHNWSDTHQAWNHGKYDQWVPAKGTTTMSHMTRHDYSVPLCLGRRLHDLRRVPLLAARPDGTQIATICGPDGSAMTARAVARC